MTAAILSATSSAASIATSLSLSHSTCMTGIAFSRSRTGPAKRGDTNSRSGVPHASDDGVLVRKIVCGAGSDEILNLITADLAATLGWPRPQGEEFVAQNAGEWAANVPRVVLLAESVQQRLHDDRVDTSWPACPKHPHHPLRLRGGPPVVWTCPATEETICGLGHLASVNRP